MPWLPVAFGIGIVIYFTADREPRAVGRVRAASRRRRRRAVAARPGRWAFRIALAARGGLPPGFAIATVKSARLRIPCSRCPALNVEIAGWIEVREERERTDRIVVRVHRIEAPRLGAKLERVRVSVRKGTAPPVGSFVELKARLSPPLEPLRPGGYDFARDLYFQGIGASGFVFGGSDARKPPEPPWLWLRYATAIAAMRDAHRRAHPRGADRATRARSRRR